MDNKAESTLDDRPPVFSNWSTWYWIVILCNIVTIGSIYLYFQAI